MFKLTEIEFSDIGRLILRFSDSVDPLVAANTLASNYVISGGPQVIGNFEIFFNQVSFDIKYAEKGKLYEIEVFNITSKDGDIVDPLYDKKSFYFGIGRITPFLVQENSKNQKLFIISDSALVGKVEENG